MSTGSDRNEGLLSISGLISREKIKKTCACGNEFETNFIRKIHCPDCCRKYQEEHARDEEFERLRLKAEADKKRIRAARIPPVWQDLTFENSDPKINTAQMEASREYATHFDSSSSGLVIYSEGVGNGKTHLAICIGNYILKVLGKRVLFKPARDLLMELRQTFTSFETAEIDRLREFLNVDLLILDDVGRDRLTEWTENTYWSLFDHCMSYSIPVIITTNRLIESNPDTDCLEDRIGTGAYSRLLKICQHTVIKVEGEDLR